MYSNMKIKPIYLIEDESNKQSMYTSEVSVAGTRNEIVVCTV